MYQSTESAVELRSRISCSVSASTTNKYRSSVWLKAPPPLLEEPQSNGVAGMRGDGCFVWRWKHVYMEMSDDHCPNLEKLWEAFWMACILRRIGAGNMFRVGFWLVIIIWSLCEQIWRNATLQRIDDWVVGFAFQLETRPDLSSEAFRLLLICWIFRNDSLLSLRSLNFLPFSRADWNLSIWNSISAKPYWNKINRATLVGPVYMLW